MEWKGKRSKVGGKNFQSKGEAGLYEYLLLRQKNGEIEEIQTQVQVYLTDARILYKPDFTFIEDGIQKWAEYKGFETAIWRIKRRLWMHYGPGILEVWKGYYPRLTCVETIEPK